MLYSRPQLKLLLALTATLLVGLGVREWRAGFPDAADRLERFDGDAPLAPLLPPPRPERRTASSADGGDAKTVAAPTASVGTIRAPARAMSAGISPAGTASSGTSVRARTS